MFKQYEDNQRNITTGDLSLLADTHASSSGLKSLCSIMASEGIETCRRACGGHGYSLASGLGSLYADCESAIPQSLMATRLTAIPPPDLPTV